MGKHKKRSRRSGEKLLYALLLIVVSGMLAGSVLLISMRGRDAQLPAIVPVQTAALSIETTTTTTSTATTTTATTAATTVTTTVTETTATTAPAESPMTLSFYHALLYLGDPAVLPVVKVAPDKVLDEAVSWESSAPDIASVDETGAIKPVGLGSCTITVSVISNPEVSAQISVTVEPVPEMRTTPEMSVPSEQFYTETLDVTRGDIEVIGGIAYVHGVMIVNKSYALPDTYNPGGLIPEAAEAFAEMRADAAEDGIRLFSHSDFRSSRSQAVIYSNYCSRDGKAAADRYSARPGYSEHQTGMSIDVNWPGPAFDGTPEAEWLEANCWKYGYILRYPRDKEDYTGYKYESWHIRYVGREWAEKITKSGLSLEEFFHVMSEYPS